MTNEEIHARHEQVSTLATNMREAMMAVIDPDTSEEIMLAALIYLMSAFMQAAWGEEVARSGTPTLSYSSSTYRPPYTESGLRPALVCHLQIKPFS